MLARAAAATEAAGVKVDWIRSDAAHFSLPERRDGAICLCEGAFGLLGAKDDSIGQLRSILSNISRSLKPGAKAVLIVLNGAAMLRRSTNEDVAEGRFDPLTMVWSSEYPERGSLPFRFESGHSCRRGSFSSSALRACPSSTCGAGLRGAGVGGNSTSTRWRS